MEAWKSDLRWGTEKPHGDGGSSRGSSDEKALVRRQAGESGQDTPPGDDQGSPGTGGGGTGDGAGGGSEAPPDTSSTSTSTSTSTVALPDYTASSTALPDNPPEGYVPTVMIFKPFENIHFFNEGTAMTLTWSPANDSVETTKISWSGRSKATGDEENIASASFRGGEDSTGLPFFKEISSDRTSVSLNLDQGPLENYTAEIMWLQLNWQVGSDGQKGVTTSPFFGIVNTDAERRDLNVTISVANGVVNSTEGTEALDTTTANPGSSSGGSGGNGGLSGGAIAGIVVGGVAFIALVAGLAWFLLRRRRKTQAVRAGYTGTGSEPAGTAAGSYMADKDPNSHVTESPGTPSYSDDERRSRGLHHTATGGAPSHNGSRTPQDRSIGFLVEEGMTEDEIRRLEEEERQLDADVERMRASRR